MEDMEDMKFVVLDDLGRKVECEVLFTFENDETEKNYVVYTDNTFDDEGKIKVYASTYDHISEQQTLYPIETEEEWVMIETLLNKLLKEIRGDSERC